MEKITFIASATMGLESIVSDEIKALGYENVKTLNGKVEFDGTINDVAKANIWLRCADRLYIKMGEFKATSFEELFQGTKKIPWEKIISKDGAFPVSWISSVKSKLFSKSDSQAIIKKAIVERLKSIYRIDHFRENGAMFRIKVQILNDIVTLQIDTSGEPLHKRGYRVKNNEAPIKETMAAALVYLTRWKGENYPLIDPTCGTGTLAIEAAMIAMDLPAQIFRKKFAFQNWKNYDAELFTKIKEFRINRVKEFTGKIVGYDIDARMLNAARINIEAAEMEDIIEVKKQNFFESEKDMFPLLMVFNPPYDERITINDPDFYKKIGDTFKQKYPNTLAWMISSDLEGVKNVGLRPSRKIKLFNGKLECRFLQYEMYEGTKKIHKLEK